VRPRHRLLALAPLVAAQLTGCGSCEDPEPAADVLVRRITSELDRVAGPRAEGRIGDYVLENGQVRLVVQDAGSATGWGVYGGSLVDLERVGPDGVRSGDDRLQEIFFHCNLRSFAASAIEIIADGSDGGPGILRVVGRDGGFPLLDAVLASAPMRARTEVDIVIPREGRVIELVQRIIDVERKEQQDVFCGPIVLRGDDLEGWVGGRGRDVAGITRAIPYFVGAAPGAQTSFVIWPESGDMDPLAPQSEVLVLSAGTDTLVLGGRVEKRWLLGIGDGDVESALAERRRRLPAATAALTPLRVQVTAAEALRPLFARMSVTLRRPDGPESLRAVTWSHVAETGEARVELEPGRYEAVLALDGVELGVQAIELGATAADVSIAATGLGLIEVRGAAVELDGARVPSAVKLSLSSGHDRPAGTSPDRRHFAAVGERVWVPVGDWTAVASLGPEYELWRQNLRIEDGAVVTIEPAPERVVDTRGWLAADMHVHAATSMDSNLARARRVIGAVAEGIEVLVATDHDVVSDDRALVDALGLGHRVVPVPGQEVSPLYGHMNGYPLRNAVPGKYWDVTWWGYDGDLRYSGSIAPDEIARRLRDEGAEIVQLNHPRQSTGVFDYLGLDPTTGQTSRPWPEVDVFELLNDTGDSDLETLLADWAGLIRAGRRITAVGVSDAHGEFGIGYARTWIRSPSDAPAEADLSQVWASLREGRAVIGTGPFLSVEARQGQASAGIGDVLVATGTVTLQVEVQAPSWMSATRLRVLAGGVVVVDRAIEDADRDPARPTIRFSGGLPIDVREDTWLVVIVEGDARDRNLPVLDARARAISNPVWIDADGDGFRPR
jgi:hypothetical protein